MLYDHYGQDDNSQMANKIMKNLVALLSVK